MLVDGIKLNENRYNRYTHLWFVAEIESGIRI